MSTSQSPGNSNPEVNEKLVAAEKVESSLRGVKISRQVLESFENHGIEPKSLAYHLGYIAILDHARKTHSSRLKHLDKQRGIPLRRLKGFPEELNDIAGRIERINATLLSDPPDSLSKFAFRQLPKELRDYAHFLNQRASSQPRILKEYRQSLISDWKQEVRFLVETVKEKTGKPDMRTSPNF